jgi:hypothetical protein
MGHLDERKLASPMGFVFLESAVAADLPLYSPLVARVRKCPGEAALAVALRSRTAIFTDQRRQ